MQLIPLEFRRVNNERLAITWQNGTQQQISARVLRTNCPCASCRELRGDSSHARPIQSQKSSGSSSVTGGSLLKVIQHSEQEELRLDSIWPVGQYGLGIQWGDGHNTGIYTYQQLYQLGSSQSARGEERLPQN